MKNFKYFLISFLILIAGNALYASNYNPEVELSMKYYIINIKQLLRFSIDLNSYRNYKEKLLAYKAKKIEECKENNGEECPSVYIGKINNEYSQLLNNAKNDIKELKEQINIVKDNLDDIIENLKLNNVDFEDLPQMFSKLSDEISELLNSDLYKNYKKIEKQFKQSFPEQYKIVSKYLTILFPNQKIKIKKNIPMVPGAKL